MPGISCVFQKGAIPSEGRARIKGALESLLHYSDYEKSIVLDDKDIFLGATRHSKYPVTVFESEDLLVCVEGRLYGKPPDVAWRELEKLSLSIFGRGREHKAEIVRWLFDTDGDFIVFMFHKPSRELCVISDAVARLPFYYRVSDGFLVASREPRFIAGVIGNPGFDREAIAQYLLLGYALGDKTVFENVRQLPPASILRAGGAGGEIGVEQLYRHNFERQTGDGGDIRERARTLAELFQTACRNRHDSEDRSVVALSGGMDSRMVSSCLAKIGLPFSSATFRYSFYAYEKDVQTAELVAKTLGSEWRLFQMEPAKGADVLELLRAKDGLNFLGMSFSMPLFRKIREAYGRRITLFTGDGGDKILRDIRPVTRIGTIDGLIKYVLATNQLMPLDLVAETTQVPKRDIIDGLRRHFLSYDEQEMRLKYVHFIICDRCMKWHFQGEDRNRFVFWPVTPMYSIQFFANAMSSPFEFKSRYNLFREMLVLFSRETADIVNTKWNLPITSDKLRYYWMMREVFLRLPVPARKFIRAHHWYRRRISVYPMASDIMKCFIGQSEHCGAISEYLSIDAIRRNLHRVDKMTFDHLFTLTSTIEDFTESRSTIEDYLDRELI